MPDAYSDWLDIPANFRPPTYYQLLGIAPSELDPKAIATAAGERLERLRAHSDGPRADEARRLAREVVQARDTLLDPVARLRYDTLSPDAADPWWKPEPETAAVTTAPVEGWWQGEAADQPPDALVPLPVRPPEPTPTPPPPAPASDWWKARPGDLPPGRAPVRPSPPPPPVTPPPPAIPQPAPAAPSTGPVIREQALAFSTSEPKGSLLPWLFAGLFGAGLATGAVLYVMKPWATPDPATDAKLIAEHKTKEELVPAVPPKKDPPVHTVATTTVPKAAVTTTAEPKKDPANVPPPKDPKSPPATDEPVTAMTFRGHNGGVFGLAVSRSGRTILSVSDDQAVLQYSPQERGKHGLVHKLGSPGLAVALCDEDRTAVFCDGGEVVVYDLPGRKVRARFENPRGGIRSLAAAPDGSFVLAGTTDGAVRWWNPKSKELEPVLDVDAKATVTALAIAPGARTVAVGLSDGKVAVWDLKGRRETKRWPAHKGAVTALVCSPDGQRIVSGGEDGVANVWQPGGTLVKKLAGHDGPVTGAAWCSDGKRVVTAGIDRTVRLWDQDKGWKADRLAETPDKAFCLALGPGDRWAVVGLSDGAVQLLPLPRPADDTGN
jgi:hypothetical protein